MCSQPYETNFILTRFIINLTCFTIFSQSQKHNPKLLQTNQKIPKFNRESYMKDIDTVAMNEQMLPNAADFSLLFFFILFSPETSATIIEN